MTPEQLRELTFWVEQYAAAGDNLVADAVAAILAVYQGRSFYTESVVTQIAEEAANASDAASLLAAGLAAQYVATTTSLMVGDDLPTPAVLLPPLRKGADMRQVYQRPMKLFRRQVAKGVPPEQAFGQAMNLATVLTSTNISLAERDGASQAMQRLEREVGITGYRRVVHPELSETGTCGLCIAASDQIYKVGTLLPLHARCKCEPLPIIGDVDPGRTLNGISIRELYKATPGTTREELVKTRYRVEEHGEYGPVLVQNGHAFTSLDDLQAA